MTRLLLLLLFCLPVFSGELAHMRASSPRNVCASGDARPLVTADMVAHWIQKWQKLLGLEEWEIDGKVVRVWELPQNTVATIHWSLDDKRVTVKVLDAVDSDLSKSKIVADTELSVIHELLHLSMAKLPLDGNHTECEEETVKRLSVALQKLDMERRSKVFQEVAAR